MEELLIGLSLGLAVGLILGTVGAGGSILAVPVLVFGADLSVQEAAGTALIIVGASAILGAYIHHRAGRTQVKTGLTLGGSGIGGAVLGSWVHTLAAEDLILLLLALLILVAATIIALRVPKPEAERTPGTHFGWPKMLAVGTTLGVATGFFGIGGGFLIIPTLVLGLGLPMRLAVGTSLLVISINSAAGTVGHFAFGSINLGAGGPILVGALIGALTGTRLGGRADENWLRVAFATLLYGVAVFLLYESITGIL